MSTKPYLGLISFTDRASRLGSGSEKDVLLIGADIANAVRARGYEVIPGGAPYPEEDQLAAYSSLARRHVHTVVDFKPAAVIFDVSAGGEAVLAVECARYLEREMKVPPRLLLCADTLRRPASFETLLDVGGVLRREGFDVVTHAGSFTDPGLLSAVESTLAFCVARRDAAPALEDVIHRSKRGKFLLVGPPGNRRRGHWVDAPKIGRVFGISVEHVEARELDARVSAMTARRGGVFVDPRVEAAVRDEGLLREDGGRTVALAHAVRDLAHEREASFGSLTLEEDDAVVDRILERLARIDGPAGERVEPTPFSRDGEFESACIHSIASAYTKKMVHPARIVGCGDHGLELATGGAVPPGEVTIATLIDDGGAWRLLAREGSIGASTGETNSARINFSEPNVAASIIESWPSAQAVLAQGCIAAALVEWACRRGLPYDVVLASGRRFRS